MLTEREYGMQRRTSLTVVGISRSGGLCVLNFGNPLALRLLLLPNVDDHVRDVLRGDFKTHMRFQLIFRSVETRGHVLILN
jgi:hypothetical protein